jgi:two-component system alkaline phosphatase synthesis response regulator PhoP
MNPKTILVVDDEFSTTEILTFVLEHEGYRVLTSFNGRDGLDKLRLSPVALVILDVMMPIMNGAEMARAMKSDPELSSVPVLITSALSEATVQGMFEGYHGFLRKPFRMESVLAMVQAILADADKRRA